MAIDRSDTGWSRAQEPFERLAWARAANSKFRTKADLARAVGEEPPTYAKYERDYRVGTNGSRMTADRARQFADPLGVRWEWLLWGEGLPWLEDETPGPAAELTRLVEGFSPEEQERALNVVRAAFGRTGTDG